MPTDTVYGLTGSAFNKKAVERIYRVRKRDRNKPFIVLIGSLNDLKKFGVKVSLQRLKIINKLWGGAEAVSIIFPLNAKRSTLNAFKYLHRGKDSIAFRLPRYKWLRELLKKTGPLVAPSANIAGKPPAETIAQAQKYFGGKIDFYFGKGKRSKIPSSIVALVR